MLMTDALSYAQGLQPRIKLFYRANAEVQTSEGRKRLDSVGGASKRAFVKLPEVGHAGAKRWFNAGYRSAHVPVPNTCRHAALVQWL